LYSYIDAKDQPIKEGDVVKIQLVNEFGEPTEYHLATVEMITDPDGDVNEYGRQIAIPPVLRVRYGDGDTEEFPFEWLATGWWDSENAPYKCSDVEVID
jgi:hypothetical protein